MYCFNAQVLMGKRVFTLICFMTVSSARNGTFMPGTVAEAALRTSRRSMVAFNVVLPERDSFGSLAFSALFFLIFLGENLLNQDFSMAVEFLWRSW
jgi:hypothetical protein